MFGYYFYNFTKINIFMFVSLYKSSIFALRQFLARYIYMKPKNRCSVCPFCVKFEDGKTRCTDSVDMETGECYMSEIVGFSTELGPIERFDSLYPDDSDNYSD